MQPWIQIILQIAQEALTTVLSQSQKASLSEEDVKAHEECVKKLALVVDALK